jgi:hypothetical protein
MIPPTAPKGSPLPFGEASSGVESFTRTTPPTATKGSPELASGSALFSQITLELMCNKKKYNKVLEKTNPKKFEEQREHLTKIEKYSPKIMNLTEKLLGSPDTQITNEINNAFDEYSKICIRYFEMKEYENKFANHHEKEEEDDEDILFGRIDNEEYILEKPSIPHSYWGKSIIKK